ncbi:MAG TPA: Ig-like domain-containing protein [Kofleriaceae bacterium]|nr:Ig-like domain-containing protein [Kofleriaceae bacterium]
MLLARVLGHSFIVAATVLAGCGDNIVRTGGENTAPVVEPLSLSTTEDLPVTGTLVATDADGDPLTLTLGTPMHGTVTNAELALTYTPEANFNGADTFSVTVSDGTTETVATVTVIVTPTNDGPVAVDDSFATPEDTALVLTEAQLVANDTDVDAGDTLSVTAVSGATNGTVALAGTTITFTPTTDFVGNATFTYTVSDGTSTDTGTVTVAVGGANDAPVAVDDDATTAEDTPLVISDATLISNDSDPDGQTVTVTAVDNATNGTVALASGDVTFTPDANFVGTATFEYTLSDGTLIDTGLVTVTVTPVNDAPVAVDDTANTDEDTAVVIDAADLLANDTDVENDALVVTIVDNASSGTVAIAGTDITYTPAANFTGTATFDYTVSDGNLTDVGTVTVTVGAVDDAPVAVNDTIDAVEDTPIMIDASDLLANDTDGDGDTLTITAVGTASSGTASLSGTVITYTPAPNANGTVTFTYTITDGTSTATATVTVNVMAVNDAPVAVDDMRATAVDTPLVVSGTDLAANDLDVDGDTLMVTAVANAMNGTVQLAGGIVTFTPAAGFDGTATFEYTVFDGVLMDTGTVTVTVIPNVVPVAVDDTASTAEDTALVLDGATLVANDVDPDPQTLVVSAVANATNGSVQLAGTTITFTPAANFEGAATFEYTVSDGISTDVGLVTVNVTAAPDAPTATDDTATVAEDSSVMIPSATLLANDSDPDTGAVLSITTVGNASNGTVSFAGGIVTYTPAANFEGTATFTYTVSDGTLTDTGTVTVTVTPVNDAPEAVGDSATTPEDTQLVFTAANLALNDLDIDVGATLSVTAVGNATNGTVQLAGGAITFMPAANFNGTATFEYTVSDTIASDTGVVTVTVTPVNDAPVAGDDTVTALGNTDTLIAEATLLANDNDIDGPSLSVTAVGDAMNGSVSLAGGVITFTPTTDFLGTASFTYTVSDGTVSDTATVTVSVESACGDGVVTPDEECDDGDLDDDDGCTSQCVEGVVCDATAFPGGNRFTVDPFTGHCYVAYDDTMTTYADAQTACVDAGGYLATITSAGEQTIVASLQAADQSPWIGAADDANTTDTVFQWVTGETWAYTNFATGEPDNDEGLGAAADCLHLVDGEPTWADTNCNLTTFVVGQICEVEPEACGDSVIQPGETCDDGNATDGDGCSATCTIEPILISEYVEGASFNKAIELRNPSVTTPYDLAANACVLQQHNNGSMTVSSSFSLTGTIAPNDVRVFCDDATTSQPLKDVCDVLTNSAVFDFNGDDALVLRCGGVVLDVIGQIGVDPGSEWGTGLTSTQDNTLRRKCTVTRGDTDGTNAFDPATEWDGFAVDTFDGLGVNECAP